MGIVAQIGGGGTAQEGLELGPDHVILLPECLAASAVISLRPVRQHTALQRFGLLKVNKPADRNNEAA